MKSTNILPKEIEEDLSKWKDMLRLSQEGLILLRCNTTQSVYRFNAIFIKIAAASFCRNKSLSLNSYGVALNIENNFEKEEHI